MVPEANWLIKGAAIALVAAAVYTDCRWRIIPNRLTIPAAVMGLLLNFILGGWSGLFGSFLGFIVGIGLMLVPFTFGQMGGGDVKFMGALGAFLGSASVFSIFIYATIAGGVLAIIVIVAKREFFSVIKRLWLLIKTLVLFRSPAMVVQHFSRSTYIPYGLAIGAGTICFFIIGKVT